MQHRAAEVAVHMGMVGVYEIGASAMGSAVAAGAVAVGVTGARVVNAGLLRWAAPSLADVTAVMPLVSGGRLPQALLHARDTSPKNKKSFPTKSARPFRTSAFFHTMCSIAQHSFC